MEGTRGHGGIQDFWRGPRWGHGGWWDTRGGDQGIVEGTWGTVVDHSGDQGTMEGT